MASWGVMFIRVIVGVVYIMHAYLALVLYKPAGMIAYQARSGIPYPEIGTWYLILAHGLGGIALVLGLYTRWAALANAPVMFGALFFVHLKNGFWEFNSPNGYEYVLVLLVVTVALLLTGGGALSLRR